jgi:hypothetical protein
VNGARGRSSRWWTAAALAAALAAGAVVFVGHDRAFAPTTVPMSRGSVWLASAGHGELTLFDGAVPEVARHAAAPSATDGGDAPSAAWWGATGYALNPETSTVTRIDGATFAAVTAADGLPTGGTQRIFATATDVYVVDLEHAEVADLDAATLRPRAGSPLAVAAHPTRDGLAVDAAGRLWLADGAGGALTWVEDGREHRAAAAPPGPNAKLAAAGRDIVVVSAETNRLVLIDAAHGRVRASRELPPVADGTLAVAATANAVDIVRQPDGVLLRYPIGTPGQDAPLPLQTAGSDELGPPVEAGGTVFVPDYTTGRVATVRLDARRTGPWRVAVNAGHRFDLFAADGRVYVNEPAGAWAGTVAADGTVHRVDKFHALSPPRPSPPPTSPPATTAPPTTPPTSPRITSPPATRTSPPAPSPPPTTPSPPVTGAPPPTPLSVSAPPPPSPSASPTGTSDDSQPSEPPRTGGPTPSGSGGIPTGAGTSGPPEPTSTGPGPSPTGPGATPTGTGSAVSPGPSQTGPDTSPSATGPPSGSPSDTPGPTPVSPSPSAPRSRVIFSDDFTTHRWTDNLANPPENGDAGYAGTGRYLVESRKPGLAYWSTAPIDGGLLTPALTVQASGRLVSPDQGGWGVWCIEPSGDRYEFLLSYTGSAAITAPGGAYLSEQATGLDPNAPHVITGSCSQTSGGIVLSMTIDGRPAGQATVPAGGGNWSGVGVHAYSFGDVPDQPLGQAYFTRFEVSRR